MNTKRLPLGRTKREPPAEIPIERVKRVVARGHVEREGDPQTVEFVRSLDAQTEAILDESAYLRENPPRIDERKVVGSVRAASILVMAMALGTSWWLFTHQGLCGQLGLVERSDFSGRVAAVSKEYCTPDGRFGLFSLAPPSLEFKEAAARARSPLPARVPVPTGKR